MFRVTSRLAERLYGARILSPWAADRASTTNRSAPPDIARIGGATASSMCRQTRGHARHGQRETASGTRVRGIDDRGVRSLFGRASCRWPAIAGPCSTAWTRARRVAAGAGRLPRPRPTSRTLGRAPSMRKRDRRLARVARPNAAVHVCHLVERRTQVPRVSGHGRQLARPSRLTGHSMVRDLRRSGATRAASRRDYDRAMEFERAQKLKPARAQDEAATMGQSSKRRVASPRYAVGATDDAAEREAGARPT